MKHYDDLIQRLRTATKLPLLQALMNEAADAIQSLTAADVRPVVLGKWKPRDLTWGRSYYYCSACEETVDMPTAMGIPMFRYCPNCGADMREES